MADLDSYTSWQLYISKDSKLDESRIDPKMTKFAGSVMLNPREIKNNLSTGRKQLTFNTELGSLKPSKFEQKTACHFRLRTAPEWVIEIARYDTYDAKNDLPVTTYWAASMSNSDWESSLSQNVTLGIGECAAQEPTLETFLPANSYMDGSSTGSGVVDFLQNVRLVTNFLDDLSSN